jgi:hypothetical protein
MQGQYASTSKEVRLHNSSPKRNTFEELPTSPTRWITHKTPKPAQTAKPQIDKWATKVAKGILGLTHKKGPTNVTNNTDTTNLSFECQKCSHLVTRSVSLLQTSSTPAHHSGLPRHQPKKDLTIGDLKGLYATPQRTRSRWLRLKIYPNCTHQGA